MIEVKLLPVTASGAHAAHLDVGAADGTTSVYIGGLGLASTVSFAPVIGHPAIAGRGRHVLVDLVGSGWSDHDDSFAYPIEEHAAVVATVIDALEIRWSRSSGTHSVDQS
ncbi:pimeloyl-ACP methyl ester carboxylesterase [Amycolatopsis bartoniae]|nr:hypothetical protein [Amycolatopsis bartoniae]MBB2940175.1 pimeloyl-ACP methyl ester carboxylesterase [Amycolatopsis bartoniae]TVT06275.1 hypothetical protein FNH07_21000 [Amycolatopsis bartoniae]